jgi:hypothetical protein
VQDAEDEPLAPGGADGVVEGLYVDQKLDPVRQAVLGKRFDCPVKRWGIKSQWILTLESKVNFALSHSVGPNTLNIMTLSIMTLSLMTLSLMTLSTGCWVISNFVIFHKIKVAKHIWVQCCHLPPGNSNWQQQLAADFPSLDEPCVNNTWHLTCLQTALWTGSTWANVIKLFCP